VRKLRLVNVSFGESVLGVRIMLHEGFQAKNNITFALG
jgi:hypothetical protein